MTDNVDLERTLEIQRLRLLRLLTGWISVLGVLSFAPATLPLPRWIRAFFDRVLLRAELAAQFLVQVSALQQATGDLVAHVPRERAQSQQSVEVCSTQMLLRRMIALRDVLENLPRHARRLLRVRKIAGEALNYSAPPRRLPVRGRMATVTADWMLPRVERPPDKGAYRFGLLNAPFTLLPHQGGGRWHAIKNRSVQGV